MIDKVKVLKSKFFGLRISNSFYANLKATAKKRDTTMSKLIIQTLEKEFERA